MIQRRTEYQIRFTDQFGIPRVWYYDRQNCKHPYNEALSILRDVDIVGSLVRVDDHGVLKVETPLAVKQYIDGEYHIIK